MSGSVTKAGMGVHLSGESSLKGTLFTGIKGTNGGQKQMGGSENWRSEKFSEFGCEALLKEH